MNELRGLLNVLSLVPVVGLIPWIVSFPFLVFFFDAPGSESDLALKLVVVFMCFYPVTSIVGAKMVSTGLEVISIKKAYKGLAVGYTTPVLIGLSVLEGMG